MSASEFARKLLRKGAVRSEAEGAGLLRRMVERGEVKSEQEAYELIDRSRASEAARKADPVLEDLGDTFELSLSNAKKSPVVEKKVPVPASMNISTEPISSDFGSKVKTLQEAAAKELPPPRMSATDAAANVAAEAMGLSKYRKPAVAAAATGALVGGSYALSQRDKAKGEEVAPAASAPAPSKEDKKGPSLSKAGKEASEPGAKGVPAAVNYVETLRGQIPDDRRDYFDAEYKKLDQARQQAIALYKEDRKALDWGRVGEMLGRSMVLLAAGMAGQGAAGMKGVAESEKWDWNTDYTNLRKELDTTLESAEVQRKGTERTEDRLYREREKAIERVGRAEDQEQGNKFKASQAELDRALEREKFKKQQDKEEERRAAASTDDRVKVLSQELASIEKARLLIPQKKESIKWSDVNKILVNVDIDPARLPVDQKWLGQDSVPTVELTKALSALSQPLRAQRKKLVGLDDAAPTPASPPNNNSAVPAEYTRAYKTRYPSATPEQIATAYSKERNK